MRANKYRVWDTREKVMLSPKEVEANNYALGSNGVMVAMDSESSEDGHLWMTSWRIPLMWTGLLDKNKVPIYEGDILFWDRSILGSVRYKYFEYLVGEGVSARALCAYKEDQLEVIGNVHENVELLKDVSK